MFILLSTVYGFTTPCPGGFDASVEWLFMLPGYDQPYFASDFDVTLETLDEGIINRRYANEQTWHSGYRLELAYAFCSCPTTNIRMRWTQFPSFSEKRRVHAADVDNGMALLLNPPFLPERVGEDIINQNFFKLAELEDTFDFWYLDLLLGWKAIDCYPFVLNLQGGLQYAHLKFREEGFALANGSRGPDSFSKTVSVNSHWWGIGPELGIDFNYFFSDCFSLTARGSSSLLIINRESKITRAVQLGVEVRETFSDVGFKNDSYWTAIPVATTRWVWHFPKNQI